MMLMIALGSMIFIEIIWDLILAMEMIELNMISNEKERNKRKNKDNIITDELKQEVLDIYHLWKEMMIKANMIMNEEVTTYLEVLIVQISQ